MRMIKIREKQDQQIDDFPKKSKLEDVADDVKKTIKKRIRRNR